MSSQTLQAFAPMVRREYWALKDQRFGVIEAIDQLAERHHVSPRGIALMLDLVPTFVDRFFPAVGAR